MNVKRDELDELVERESAKDEAYTDRTREMKTSA